jgi:hypothetical protein
VVEADGYVHDLGGGHDGGVGGRAVGSSSSGDAADGKNDAVEMMSVLRGHKVGGQKGTSTGAGNGGRLEEEKVV